MKRIFLLFVFIPCLSFGQNMIKKWSLRECVEYGKQKNLNIKRSLLGVENAQASHDQAIWNQIPTLNLGASGGTNFGRNIDPTTNRFINQEITTVGLTASSSVVIYNGFTVRNNIKRAKSDLNASLSDLKKAENDVMLAVVTNFLTVVFNRELLEVNNLQLQTSKEQLRRIEKLVKAGSSRVSDEMDQRAQVATNELNVVTAENNLLLAILVLKQVMQLPANEPFDIDIPDFVIGKRLDPSENSNDIYQVALTTLPEIKSVEIREEGARMNEKSARGRFQPSLTANFSFNTNFSSAAQNRSVFDFINIPPTAIGTVQNSPTDTVLSFSQTTLGRIGTEDNGLAEQLGTNRNGFVGIRLNIPIFNNRQTRLSVQQARISRENASIQKTDVETVLRQTIEQSYFDVVAAEKTYYARQKQVEALEESFRVTEKQYNLGAVNSVDYQVISNNLNVAKSDFVRSKYDLIFKGKILDFYQGKPLY
jgi:outer membrane protein